jgi:hypothetical protein
MKIQDIPCRCLGTTRGGHQGLAGDPVVVGAVNDDGATSTHSYCQSQLRLETESAN